MRFAPSWGPLGDWMERAARVIQKSKSSRQIISDEELARAAWPAAVGKAIAAHTSGVRLVRTTLVVEVEDAIWQRQLHFMTRQIVERMRKMTGGDAIDDVEFRIAVPRKQPQRAESAHSVEQGDEAEQIQDPMLRKLYRMSRKKASA
jgi:predicted nucleic acid-binding Zn ribbon protein